MKKNPTIREIVEAYVAAKEDPHAFKRCLHPENIKSSLKRIVIEWGDLPIKTFNKKCVKRVEDAFSKWSAEGAQSSTQRKALALFRAACNHACKRKMIKRNQVPMFDLPPMGPPRERVLSKDELRRLLEAAKTAPRHTRLGLYLCLILGSRSGAIKALKWEHIDFENRVVRLRDTQSATTRAHNKKRRENQPLNDYLYDLLLAEKQRAKSDYVIEYRGGGVGRFYVSMKSLFARAGLPDLWVHDLRRSSASFVFDAAGGDLAKAAAHIGDTVEIARKHYVHGSEKVKLGGIDAMSELVREAQAA